MINKGASGALNAHLLLKKRSTRMMRMRSNMKDECYIMSVEEGGGGGVLEHAKDEYGHCEEVPQEHQQVVWIHDDVA